jgi:hypothetical protein
MTAQTANSQSLRSLRKDREDRVYTYAVAIRGSEFAIRGEKRRSTMATRWKPALKAFAVTFEGRIPTR